MGAVDREKSLNKLNPNLHKKSIRPGRARRALALTTVAFLTFPLTGCFDRQELEQQAFVSTLGIDKAPDGMIDCTFRIALPKSQGGGGGSGGGGGGQDQAGTKPFTVRGHTVLEALQLANSSVERVLTMTHMNQLILGEDLARAGVLPELQPLTRFREFRRTMMVSVAKGSAKEYMQTEKPVVEQSQNRLADDVADVGSRTGLNPMVCHLHDLLSAVETPHENPVVPIFAVNKNVQSDSEGKGKLGNQKVSYKPGQQARTGGDPVEWMGAAVFRDDKMVGELNGLEVFYLRLLQGTIHRTRFDLPDKEHNNQHVTVWLRRERNPSYNIQLGNPLRVTVNVPLEGDLVNSEPLVNFATPPERTRLQLSFDQTVAKNLTDVLNKTAHEYRVDTVPISRNARYMFASDAALRNYPWEERLKTAQFDVHVNLKLRRFGVQMAPLEVNE